MRIARIGLPRDALEGEGNAHRRAGCAHALVDLRRALRAAEFRIEVRAPLDALPREVGIELERMPAHDGVPRCAVAGGEDQRRFQPALANEAPRAHDIGDDIDGQRRRGCFAHALFQ
jgi:hypothetical protein